MDDIGKYLPDTKLITVCDRGADIASFLYKCAEMKHCDVIVRAKSDRRIPGEILSLFEIMRSEKEAGTVVITIPRRSERPKLSGKAKVTGREKRTATLSIRYSQVKISPPPEMKKEAPREFFIVSAIELDPPKGEDAVIWHLLTTLTINSLDDAVLCVKYYTKRWSIEEFHRVLKTGCQVEYLAHKDITRIKRALAVYIVVACRLMLLLKLGREIPDLPAEVLFDDVEIEVLSTYFSSKKRPLTNLRNMIILIAKLGGYLDRNNDPLPGYEVFWKGYEALQYMCNYERKRRKKAA
ncbi:MAG: IS4 family transposase [Lachnospiraceae bacterium]|nr:IS4 family transposase [Lachnospiraceae bacterium]